MHAESTLKQAKAALDECESLKERMRDAQKALDDNPQ
jgi:hypothetical protein